ncbi:hypothetical protein D9758_002620 [Tetrapyrgos nigripes]|uniref:Cation/H+ exchanger transmembrane domain-containing protein n=1 Tax=Tetrapyrgos nigripes TaxID=182062 RepID=A0A8H5GQG9_9AGAR|nr:hypothetical protein D9758_002620 [Tetrapyrgos nigripes]
MPELLEITTPSLAYICLGGFAVAFSMVSLLVKEKFYINEGLQSLELIYCVFLSAKAHNFKSFSGQRIAIGPHGANAFDPRSWSHESNNEITLEVMRVVLATGLFAIGVEIPRSYMRDHAKGLLVLVVPTMAIGWGIVSGILYALFPQIGFYGCLVIAACLTPTDPIICAALVGGKFAVKHVPLNLRQILSAESAANDGLAYPFLSISTYLILDATSREAVGHWFLIGWLYQVICGTVLGAVMGMLFSYMMRVSHRRGYIDRESYVAQYLALAFLTIGIASTLGIDDLLAAFAAGNALSWDGQFNRQTEGDVFSAVLDLILNCACFVYIGAWLPFASFNDTSLGLDVWRLVVLVLAILVLRRIPSILVLYKWVEEIKDWKEALFTGHFGPMGVGAIFVSTLAVTRLPEAHNPPQNQEEHLALVLQPIVSFVVLCSIIIHGLSIPFFTMSRTVSRTLSIPISSTTRSTLPDWALDLRRAPIFKSASGTSTPMQRNTSNTNVVRDIDVDVEAGIGEDYVRVHDNGDQMKTKGKGKEKEKEVGTAQIEDDIEQAVSRAQSPVNVPGTLIVEKRAVQFTDIEIE